MYFKRNKEFQERFKRRATKLFQRYGHFCQQDAALAHDQFTFHIKTCRVPVNQGLCYMNMETEQFFLKPRGDRLLMNQNPSPLPGEKERLPKEIITIEVEQPSLTHGYQAVEFFLTGKV